MLMLMLMLMRTLPRMPSKIRAMVTLAAKAMGKGKNRLKRSSLLPSKRYLQVIAGARAMHHKNSRAHTNTRAHTHTHISTRTRTRARTHTHTRVCLLISFFIFLFVLVTVAYMVVLMMGAPSCSARFEITDNHPLLPPTYLHARIGRLAEGIATTLGRSARTTVIHVAAALKIVTITVLLSRIVLGNETSPTFSHSSGLQLRACCTLL